jgi:hypothetical protein
LLGVSVVGFNSDPTLHRRSAQGRDSPQAAQLRVGRLLDGSGEVARYIGKYGSKGVSKVVIIGGVPLYLLKAADNPDGVDASVFEGIQKAVAANRYAFFTEFFNFFNTDVFLGTRISEQAVQASWNVAAAASPTASLACVPAWHEELPKWRGLHLVIERL